MNANIDYATRQLVIADPAPLVYSGRRADNRYAFQKSDFNNFGPRLGIAYQVTDRLVMRSGFGCSTTARTSRARPPGSCWSTLPICIA